MEDLAFTSRAFKISPTSTILSSPPVTRIMSHGRHLGIWEYLGIREHKGSIGFVWFVKVEEYSVGKRHFEGGGKQTHSTVCFTSRLWCVEVFASPSFSFNFVSNFNPVTTKLSRGSLDLLHQLPRDSALKQRTPWNVTTCPFSIIQLSSIWCSVWWQPQRLHLSLPGEFKPQRNGT